MKKRAKIEFSSAFLYERGNVPLSFDKKLDRSFDQAMEGVGRGFSSFGNQVIVPCFRSISSGCKEVWVKKEWKSQKFLVYILVVFSVAIGLGMFEKTFMLKEYGKQPFVHWLYFRQKLLPYPLGILFLFVGLSGFFYKRGKEIERLRWRFAVAFERCGLYSKRRLIKEDRTIPEYPTLFKETRDSDDGVIFVFKNVGIPLETWQDAKINLEASLEKTIGSIQLYNQNPGYIAVKVGGAQIPRTVEFNEELMSYANHTSIVVGMSKAGPVTHDWGVTPHLIIGGVTGSGKTVLATSVGYQCIAHLNGILYIIDFKKGPDYVDFEDMGLKIIYDRLKVVKLFEKCLIEHEERMKLIKQQRVRDIGQYNAKCPEKPLRRIFLLVDELAELTDRKSCPRDERDMLDQIIGLTSSIARLCRASGIHLILATQRPDANVVPGQIKTNVTGRLCGYMKDKTGYQIIIDHVPKTRIPDPREWRGRFIYSLGVDDTHIQTPYFQEKHVDKTIRMEYQTGTLTPLYQIDMDDDMEMHSPVASQRIRKLNLDDFE
jgi:hypothetical protein